MSTRKTSIAVSVDRNELTVRLLEVGLGLKRPSGKSARQILDDAETEFSGDPAKKTIVSDFEHMAQASLDYMLEQLKKADPVQ